MLFFFFFALSDYLLKYLNKDVTQLASTLSYLHFAKDRADKYPSTAVDPDKTLRYGQHVITCMLNKLNGTYKLMYKFFLVIFVILN